MTLSRSSIIKFLALLFVVTLLTFQGFNIPQLFNFDTLGPAFLAILNSLISVFLIFKILKKITKRNEYGFLASAIFLAWGVISTNYLLNEMLSLSLTLFIINSNLSQFENPKLIKSFIVGFLCFLISFFKLHYFLILVPIIISYFSLKTKKILNLSFLLYGFLWGLIFFLIYLIATNSFRLFLSYFYYESVVKPFFDLQILLSFFGIFYSWFSFLLGLLYFSPFILPIIASAVLIYRRRFYLLFIPLIFIIYFLIMLILREEFIKIIPLISINGICMSLIMNQYPTTFVKFVGYLLGFTLISLVLFLLYFF